MFRVPVDPSFFSVSYTLTLPIPHHSVSYLSYRLRAKDGSRTHFIVNLSIRLHRSADPDTCQPVFGIPVNAIWNCESYLATWLKSSGKVWLNSPYLSVRPSSNYLRFFCTCAAKVVFIFSLYINSIVSILIIYAFYFYILFQTEIFILLSLN